MKNRGLRMFNIEPVLCPIKFNLVEDKSQPLNKNILSIK
jgi:hypothetical protein